MKIVLSLLLITASACAMDNGYWQPAGWQLSKGTPQELKETLECIWSELWGVCTKINKYHYSLPQNKYQTINHLLLLNMSKASFYLEQLKSNPDTEQIKKFIKIYQLQEESLVKSVHTIEEIINQEQLFDDFSSLDLPKQTAPIDSIDTLIAGLENISVN